LSQKAKVTHSIDFTIKLYLHVTNFILMRKLLLIILLLISHFGYAQNDNKIITSIIARQESDWNRNDISSYAMAFSDDAVLINFLGLFWKGRKEIVEQFRLINECCIKPTRVKFEIKDIK